MRRFLTWSALVLLALSFGACASAGKRFKYENRSQIALGRTTPNQAREILGRPFKTAQINTPEGAFEILRFEYASANLSGATARVLITEYKSGVLNSYVYSSGFAEDSTDFDMEASASIKTGDSTMADVEALMGPPTGRAYCPSVLDDYKTRCEGSHSILLWQYVSKTRGLNVGSAQSKSVFVMFDEAGQVLTFESSGGNL